MDQFLNLALFISENRHLFPSDMPSPFSVCLLPLLLRHMKDVSNQVAASSFFIFVDVNDACMHAVPSVL